MSDPINDLLATLDFGTTDASTVCGAYMALSDKTARIGMTVYPSNAATLLPERFASFTLKRFIHNEHDRLCAVLTDGRHEKACVPVDTLWAKG